eukprot:1322875-Pyramimonas_sp.AAC.1
MYKDPVSARIFQHLLTQFRQTDFAVHSTGHVKACEEYVRHAMETAFPVRTTAAGRQPRQSWISVSTLSMQDERSKYLRLARKIGLQAHRATVRIIFFAWQLHFATTEADHERPRGPRRARVPCLPTLVRRTRKLQQPCLLPPQATASLLCREADIRKQQGHMRGIGKPRLLAHWGHQW